VNRSIMSSINKGKRNLVYSNLVSSNLLSNNLVREK
jgi:hypothetical protein